jgi:hypothetical protein
MSNTCSDNIRWLMDRRYELEILRRSIAMLTPGQSALSREQALELLQDLADTEQRLERLKFALRTMADEA